VPGDFESGFAMPKVHETVKAGDTQGSSAWQLSFRVQALRCRTTRLDNRRCQGFAEPKLASVLRFPLACRG